MRVLVTGATGFIGRHVVQVLRALTACEVVALGRDERTLSTLDVPFVVHDIHDTGVDLWDRCGQPEVLIHLAWSDLGNYRDPIHFEQTLASHYRFLKTIVASGLPRLAGVGTCYEYGLQSGALAEDTATRPTIAYAVAKDTLHRFLVCLQSQIEFDLRWLRLFFLYGDGQPRKALLALVDDALQRGETVFRMSAGEQLRDYLPVEDVAQLLVESALQPDVSGAINICRGKPISVRSLVEQRIRERGGSMTLELGYYPYPSHEPLAFWGDIRKLATARDSFARWQVTRMDGLRLQESHA